MNPNMAHSLASDHLRESRQQAARAALGRTARRVARVIAECNYAQRRMFALRTSPDTYAPGGAPGTYAEFLFRTSGGLLHEPTADQRQRGRLAA